MNPLRHIAAGLLALLVFCVFVAGAPNLRAENAWSLGALSLIVTALVVTLAKIVERER
jgi:hypothetical protein